MFRGICAGLFIVAAMQAAAAQTAKPKSPHEIAAASEAIALKRETCRLEAKEKKLSFNERRKYVKDCVGR